MTCRRNFLAPIAMPRAFLMLSVCAIAWSLASGTLSSADRKSKEKFKEPRNMTAFNKGYVKLSEYDKIQLMYTRNLIYYEERNYPYPSLAYVTPWNKNGYEIARQAAKKFDMLSPVWFNVHPSVINNRKSCLIDGAFNVNRGWMEAVRSNNSDIRIVPRFLFTGFSKADYTSFVLNEIWQRNCVIQIVNIILRNELQGAVLEVWSAVMDQIELQYRGHMLEFVDATATLFHSHNLTIVLPVHAELDDKSLALGVTLPEDVSQIAGSVDFVHVKTYNFKTAMLRGVSPLYWIRENVRYMIKASPETAHKLLMGINFFGYRVKTGDVAAAQAPDFQNLLEEGDTEVYWDSVTEETVAHSLKRKEMIYFPTIDSLSKRLELAKKHKLGVAIWELGQGFSYFTKLL